MRSLVLIDGSSLLTTSFYGNLPKEYYKANTEEARAEVLPKIMQTKNGVYTNGVYTFVKKLLKIQRVCNPSHLAVAWDITRNTFRREIYPDYKATRDVTKPELKDQFPLMQDLLDAMGVAQFKFSRYEADDIIGTLAKRFENEIPIYIWTNDQDALQLVSDKTRLWLITGKATDMYSKLKPEDKPEKLPDGVFEFTPAFVREFYGIEPQQIIDMKALEGDTSDNIPGVNGIGEKAVLPLLKAFGTIDNLYANIEGLTPTGEKEMVDFFKGIGLPRSPLPYLLKQPKDENELVGKKAAFLSKQLVTIVRDIAALQTTTLDEMLFNINLDKTRKKFEELEFTTLVEKINK